MSFSFKEILKAWARAANPTEKQKELAEKRMHICDNCEHKKEIIKDVNLSVICGSCGCPLSKKIFSPNLDACPKHKWLEVEIEYKDVVHLLGKIEEKQKINKTFL